MCSNPILTVERPMPDYTPIEGHWLRVFAFFGVQRLVAAFQSAVFRSPCSPCFCGESNGGQEFTTEAQRTRRNLKPGRYPSGPTGLRIPSDEV